MLYSSNLKESLLGKRVVRSDLLDMSLNQRQLDWVLCVFLAENRNFSLVREDREKKIYG